MFKRARKNVSKLFKDIKKRSTSIRFVTRYSHKKSSGRCIEEISEDDLTIKQIKALGVPNFYEDPNLNKFKNKYLDSFLIEREALIAGLRVRRFNDLLFEAKDEIGTTIGFHWSTGFSPSVFATHLSTNKHLVKTILALKNIPIAEGNLFSVKDLKNAVDYFNKVNHKCVVKPSVGTGGLGVTTGISSEEELRWAWDMIIKSKRTMSRNNGYIIIEEHISGDDFRFIVVGGKVVSVYKRVRAHIVGDGVSSIAELVNRKKNMRQSNPCLSGKKYVISKYELLKLNRRKTSINSIPEKGEVIFISSSGSISQGGEPIKISTDDIDASIIKAVEKATNSIPGLLQAGVDMIMQDFRLPLSAQKAAICEINKSPAICSHHFPAYGMPVNVAKLMLLTNAKYCDAVIYNKSVSQDKLTVYIKCLNDIDVIVEEIEKISDELGVKAQIRFKQKEAVEIHLIGESALIVPPLLFSGEHTGHILFYESKLLQ